MYIRKVVLGEESCPVGKDYSTSLASGMLIKALNISRELIDNRKAFLLRINHEGVYRATIRTLTMS